MMPPLSLAADRRQLLTTASDIAAWWWTVVRMSARQGWDALPGPWPVKVALVLLLIAGQAIPGELDELLLILAIGWVKRRLDAKNAAGNTPS
jgi:hypothetical protein